MIRPARPLSNSLLTTRGQAQDSACPWWMTFSCSHSFRIHLLSILVSVTLLHKTRSFYRMTCLPNRLYRLLLPLQSSFVDDTWYLECNLSRHGTLSVTRRLFPDSQNAQCSLTPWLVCQSDRSVQYKRVRVRFGCRRVTYKLFLLSSL